ncbi:MAG TPA: hypothetical protein VGY56_01005 [Verrucomicrobiae bacterium]|nr:hypothetical protein [Verrucomicrobiae bacterium]
MKIAFQFEPVSKTQITVPIARFSFAAFPVRIKHNFPCFSDPTATQSNPVKHWLSRIFHALAGTVCKSATTGGLHKERCVAGPTRLDKTRYRLRIVEDETLASAWTARALAARVFIGIQHPESTWLTERLPVALWPKALKKEIQQAGFAKVENVQVIAA